MCDITLFNPPFRYPVSNASWERSSEECSLEAGSAAINVEWIVDSIELTNSISWALV